MLNDALTNVTVIGAAGKMGSGIALLLLQEMTRLDFEESPAVNRGQKTLNLVDRNKKVLEGLQSYLTTQLTKFAEKNLSRLEGYFEAGSAITGEQLINSFVERSLAIANFTINMKDAGKSKMVFEAIFERLEIKSELLVTLKKICSKETNFFSNTSSIPIHVIEEAAGVKGRLIGFHFYNPPAVQKLVELISSKYTPKALSEMSMELGMRLGKVMVPSNDIAGFIGNGHFIRDGLYGLQQVVDRGSMLQDYEAIYMYNRLTQDFMVRPMGIFQLIDYVGIDVFQMILNTMNRYIEDEDLSSDIIDDMMWDKVSGGQFHDGSQKDGFLKYENNKPVGVYSLEEERYVPLNEGNWTKICDERLGDLPKSHQPWKALSRDPEKGAKLNAYFKELFQTSTLGAVLAQGYLLNSKEISQKLVSDGVAASSEDVGKVLMNGFFHLYAPENEAF